MCRILMVGALAGFLPTTLRAADDDAGKFEKFVLTPTLGVWSIAPSPDGKLAAMAIGDFTVRIWDLDKGEEIRQWKAHSHPAIHRVAFSPDGKHVFSCSEDATMRQWDVATGKEVREFKEHIVAIKSLDVSPDGKRILSAGSDANLRLFDVGTGKVEHTMDIPDGLVGSPFVSVAFAPKDNRALAGNAKGYVSLWDLKNGKQINLFSGQKGAVTAISYLPDGKEFVSADGVDGTIRLWSIAMAKVTRTFQGHEKGVSSVAVSPDGKRMVSGGADGTVRLWDLKAGKQTHKWSEHTKAVTQVIFNGNNRVLSCSEDGSMIHWQLAK